MASPNKKQINCSACWHKEPSVWWEERSASFAADDVRALSSIELQPDAPNTVRSAKDDAKAKGEVMSKKRER